MKLQEASRWTQWFRNRRELHTLPRGLAQVPTVNGTDSSISFGNQAAGTYTVLPVQMSGVPPLCQGNAVVTMTSLPATPVFSAGAATQCSGTTNQVYSVAEVPTATSYNWTLPAGWTITGGNGTREITATVGTNGGTVSVTATNFLRCRSCRHTECNGQPDTCHSKSNACLDRYRRNLSLLLLPAPGGTTYTWPAPTMSAGVTGSRPDNRCCKHHRNPVDPFRKRY